MNVHFEQAFQKYCSAIQQAVTSKAHHDQRRALFFDFLKDGFKLAAEEVELEKGVYGLRARGLIDALYKDVIFEFKRDLNTERDIGKDELTKYIDGLKDKGRHFGILTDGIVFEVYMPSVEPLFRIPSCVVIAHKEGGE